MRIKNKKTFTVIWPNLDIIGSPPRERFLRLYEPVLSNFEYNLIKTDLNHRRFGFEYYDTPIKKAIRKIGTSIFPIIKTMKNDNNQIIKRLKKSVGIKKSYCIIISVPPFEILLKLKILKKNTNKIIIDLRDSPINPFSSIFEKLMGIYYNKLIRRYCDLLITTSNYDSGKNTVFIPTPYKQEDKKIVMKLKKEERIKKKKILIYYFGSIHGKRIDSFKYFIKLIKKYNLNKKIRIKIFTSSAKYLSENYVSYKKYITNRKVYYKKMLEADFLLLLQNRKGRADQIPIKVYDYFLTGKPIIYIGNKKGVLFKVLKKYAYVITEKNLKNLKSKKTINNKFLTIFSPTKQQNKLRKILEEI